MICLHIDLRGISSPENSFVFDPTEYQTGERDGELMHLTAESTSKESSGLATQTVSRLEIKTGKKDASSKDLRVTETGRREKEKEMGRGRDGHCHPPCSAHLLI